MIAVALRLHHRDHRPFRAERRPQVRRRPLRGACQERYGGAQARAEVSVCLQLAAAVLPLRILCCQSIFVLKNRFYKDPSRP